MIVGFAPFYTGSTDERKMFLYIQRSNVFFPDPIKHKIYMSSACKAFISACLSKTPSERLGTRNDVAEVLAHPWFNELDIEAVKARDIEPDYLPKVGKKDSDSSNFSGIYMSKEMGKSVVPFAAEEKVRAATDKKFFSGFN
jgi:serine/threonine protein kinase